MGYKCPNCHKDFGFDREKLNEHLASSPKCAAEAYVRTEIWKVSVGIKKAKIPYGRRGDDVQHRVVDEVSENHHWVKQNLVANPDGSDTMVCSRCGLKAKRFGSSMQYDMRYTHKIQYCID